MFGRKGKGGGAAVMEPPVDPEPVSGVADDDDSSVVLESVDVDVESLSPVDGESGAEGLPAGGSGPAPLAGASALADPGKAGRKRKGKDKGKANVASLPGDAEGDDTLPSVSLLTRIRRIHEGCIEDLSGSRYVVWDISGGDITDDQAVSGWNSLLNSIEYPVQVILRQHSPDFTDVRQNMLASRPAHMREGRINDVCNSLLDYLRSLEESSTVVSREWYVIGREERVSELQTAMSQSGINATRLGDLELGLLYQGMVSGMRAGHQQEVFQLREYPNDLEMNHRYASVWEVSKWARRSSPLFMELLLRSGIELDLSLWVWPVSMRESHSRLQMQRSRFEGSRLAAEQKGRLVPPEVSLAISDITRISDGVERGVSRLFRRTLAVAVYGRSRDHLKEVEERLKGHFRSSLAGVSRLKYRQGQAFASMMPTLKKSLGSMNLTDSDTMMRMYPFGPRDLDTREGTLLGIDLRSKTTVFVDPFSPKQMNGHMVVMARSGAGKSFFTKIRVKREATRGVPVYLIDPEGEYGVITHSLGGRVYVPGAKGHGLNPFVVRRTTDSDLTRRISGLCSLIGVMLEGNASQDMKAVIDQSLTRFYAREWVTAGESANMGEGGMAAFHQYLQSEEALAFGGDKLAHLLSPFATGSARYLMQAAADDLLANESPVTSFNLRNLPSNLKPVATSICAEVVWGLAITDPRPRILVVDECWTVLATPSGAEALLTIVKRARKYQLGLIAITQDVQDFLAEDHSGGVITGHAGRALLQNSAMKLAFQQDPAALPQVVEALGLTPDIKDFLSGSLRGQGVLVGSSGDCYPLEIVATPAEYDLVTDRAWLRDGDEEMMLDDSDLPAPGVPMVSVPDSEDFADSLLRRLSMERELDAIAVA